MPVRFSLYFNKTQKAALILKQPSSSHLEQPSSSPWDAGPSRRSFQQLPNLWRCLGNQLGHISRVKSGWVSPAIMGFRHLLRICARKLLIKKSYRWTVLLLDQIILWKANLQTPLEQPVSANLLNIKKSSAVITLPQSKTCFLLGKGSRNAIMLVQSWASGCRDRSVPTSQIRSNTQTHTSKQCNAVHLFDPISAIKGGYHHGMESDMLQSFCSRNTVRFYVVGHWLKECPSRLLHGSQPFWLTITIIRSNKKEHSMISKLWGCSIL